MKCLIGLVVSMLHLSVYGTIVVRGNSLVAPFAFKTAIQSQTYDRRSGMFFVGLHTGSDTYTISKANRPSFNGLASFTPVLTATDPLMLQTSSIEFLAFSPQTTANQVLVGVQQQGSIPQITDKIFGLFTDGSQQQETASLNDAAGLESSGIIGIAASSKNVFAAVLPNGGNWGDLNSGIAMVGIGATNTALTLSTKNAPAGIDGNLATELDDTSAVLKGTSGVADVIITNTAVALVWDDTLARLFIGVEVSQAAGAGNITKSIVVGRISLNALVLEAVAPDNAITGGMGEIAVNKTTASSFDIEHLAVMHASTGPDYLIIDDHAATPGRRIFAVPLVNDVSNPTSATNGTFAKYDSSLDSNKKFTVPATGLGDLVIDNAETYPEAVVGAGNLPLRTDDHISDLIVVDDGVYVSIGDNNGASLVDSDRGIFYSQAMFDSTGKIIRWTPWTKRVIPFNAFPNTTLPGGATHNGAITFMEVDAKTGNVWFVEGTTGRTVGITSWSTGDTTNGLLRTLGVKMFNGIYSLLDLDQATRGFLGTTVHRYALFGGVNKVAFAHTSVAFDSTDASADQTYSSSPQTTITDFSTSANFLLTNLPENAGCCNVLEYSRTSTTADANPSNTHLNYFFAGTNTGLFVFSDGGAGFNAEDLQTLDTAPFSDGSWQKVESITGQVIDIKTSGSNGALSAVGTLYVITSESTIETPLKSTLYAIPFASTTTTMFASGNIRTLGQTGIGAFEKTLQFYGMQIIATGNPRSADPGDKEQLILTTNQGLFVSMADQGAGDGTISAANQTAANWHLVQDTSGNPTTATTMFNGISGPNTPVRQTAWPFNLKDIANFSIFDRGNINQLSGFSNDSGLNPTFNTFFIPLNFNANSTAPAFKTLDRISDLFSDGGRRFFIFNRTQDPATIVKMGVLPFNVAAWNATQAEILSYPSLNVISRFYEIQTIGATGILLVGTESGAVGLE